MLLRFLFNEINKLNSVVRGSIMLIFNILLLYMKWVFNYMRALEWSKLIITIPKPVDTLMLSYRRLHIKFVRNK